MRAMSLRQLLRARPDDADPLGRHPTDAHPGVEGKEEAGAAEEAERRGARRPPGAALRRGPPGRAPRAPGDGHVGEERRDQARREGVQPARHPRPGLQGAERGGAGPRLPVADPPGATRPGPGRRSSTGPTTRTCWWCGSTIWCPRPSGGPATTPSTGSRRSWPSSGVTVVKCLLHISYEYQRERLLARLDDPTKRWKFNEGDIEERGATGPPTRRPTPKRVRRCNAAAAPWYVVPADRRWYRRWAVSPDPERDPHRAGPAVPRPGRPRRRRPQEAPGREPDPRQSWRDCSRRAFRISSRTGRSDRSTMRPMTGRRYLSMSGTDSPEDVAEAGDPHRPQQAPDDVVGHEGAVLHRAHPGEDRGEGPHDRDEPGQHDRLRAVALEVLPGLLDVLLLEDPRVGPAEQRRADPVPEGVADLVAGHGGHEAADEDDRQRGEVPLGRQQAGREEERVAGQEEPDQQARLGENDGEQADEADGLER